MKYIFSILFLAISVSIFGQDAKTELLTDSVTQPEYYRLFASFIFENDKIKMNYGGNEGKVTLKDNNGKDLKFYSLIGAINYLSLQGWDFGGEAPSLSAGSSIGIVTAPNIVTNFQTSNGEFMISRWVTKKEIEKSVTNSIKNKDIKFDDVY